MSRSTMPNQTNSFTTLMKYIQKSTLVNDKTLLENAEIKLKATALKSALIDGSAHHPIFDDKNCQLYLIYLLKEELIPPEQFLTGYIYLSVLMQFTEKQLIHPEHIAARRLDWGDVKVFNARNTELLEQYAAKISAAFNHKISTEEIIRYYGSLQNSEGWLIAMPYNSRASGDDVKKMMDTNISSSPLLQKITEQNQDYVLIPSIGFTKWLLQKLNPERQIEIAPCFGNVGIETLYNDLHSQNKHPITIHSAYIKSNPKKIHNMQAGPVPFALHDIFFHCFGGSAFKKDEYHFLMNVMIPTLQKIIDSEKDIAVKSMATKMRDIINDLAYNPRNIIKSENLTNNLRNKLDTNEYGSNEFGQLNENEMPIYFMTLQKLCQELHNRKDISAEYLSNLLNNIINMNFINDVEFVSATSRQEAITSVAAILKTLPTSLSDEERERKLTDYLLTKPEICLTINRGGFPFLPPLHPLSKDLIKEAILSIQQVKASASQPSVIKHPSTMFSDFEKPEHKTDIPNQLSGLPKAEK